MGADITNKLLLDLVSGSVGPPLVLNLQFWQGLFYDKLALAIVQKINLAGNAPGERHHTHFVAGKEMPISQGLDDGFPAHQWRARSP